MLALINLIRHNFLSFKIVFVQETNIWKQIKAKSKLHDNNYQTNRRLAEVESKHGERLLLIGCVACINQDLMTQIG